MKRLITLTTLTLSGVMLSGLLFPASAQVQPVPRLMDYRGTLSAPDGNYRMHFFLYDAETGGNLKWEQHATFPPVMVINGQFSIQFSNFPTNPSPFDVDLWLEILADGAPPIPRVRLTTVPYAFKADYALKADTVADGAIGAAQIADGSITAVKLASGILGSTGWLLDGNAGTDPLLHFLGTKDNQPFSLRVNNKRAAQWRYDESISSNFRGINVLMGSELNLLASGIVGATISGGGRDSITGTDYPNRAQASFSTIGGGFGNVTGGVAATVSGGGINYATGNYATVPGGYGNNAKGNFSFASGRSAYAQHEGTFVWADSQANNFSSTELNQFLIRAAGGVGINKANPTPGTLDVAGMVKMTGFQLAGSASAGSVLTNDGTGVGTWQPLPAGTSSGWSLTGNSNTTPLSFLGTTNNRLLVFKVNNSAAMRYSYAENTSLDTSYQGINVLGGASVNEIGPAGGGGPVVGATISGGGYASSVFSNAPNQVFADFGTIGGGAGNTVQGLNGLVGGGRANSASHTNTTVGGGFANMANGYSATIAGGYQNMAGGAYAAVGGGQSNSAMETNNTIGGGSFNRTSGSSTTVGGGSSNSAMRDGATVGGGVNNRVSGISASVGGGQLNTANGNFATVPGGSENAAGGQYSFAAGRLAQANHDGTFIWADSQNAAFSSTGYDQFLVRAEGGVGINKGNPEPGTLDVAGSVLMTGFRLTTGASADRVLISDSNGNGTWGAVASLLGTDSITDSMIQSVDWSKIANAPTFTAAWNLAGNTATGSEFLGTLNAQPLELRVNNHRAMRYSHVEYEDTFLGYHSVNVLGGSETNTITPGVAGATIAGGGIDYLLFADTPNQVTGNFGTVGGGVGNVSGGVAVVSGGWNNIARGPYASIPGGLNNSADGVTSLAAGCRAKANHDGTFVWADGQEFDFASTGNRQFLVRAGGGVGINTNTPAGYTLFVNGSIAGVGAYNNVSDARYKHHIAPFENALDTILGLRGVTFDWRRDEFQGMHFPEGRQVGFIAQEVEKVLPELVTTDSNGYKSVAYSNVVPILVEAIKQQHQQHTQERMEIQTLKTENSRLKTQMTDLLRRLEALEQTRPRR